MQPQLARDMFLEGRTDEALRLLDDMLAAEEGHVAALRLKGNILEYLALEQAERNQETPLKHPGMWEARQCYERILELDPDNTLALVDLGDHFKNLYAYVQAEDFYRRAIGLLERGVSRWSLRDEINEVFDSLVELYEETGRISQTGPAREEQDALIARLPPASAD